jgi:hypothetical protein
MRTAAIAVLFMIVTIGTVYHFSSKVPTQCADIVYVRGNYECITEKKDVKQGSERDD